MKTSPRTVSREFSGQRILVETPLTFEAVRSRLGDALGHTSIPAITAVAKAAKSPEDFAQQVERRFVGKSGFMLFSEIDHGWIGIFGIPRKALRLILGNPLIAITMLRHDLNAGLFVPVELLLTDNADSVGSHLMYVRPSSLIVVDNNPELLAAARALDDKLEALVLDCTSF